MFARSDIDFVKGNAEINKDNIQVSYLGNLGLNRHLPLLEIADALNEISSELKLTVYGSATEDVVKAFTDNPNVDFRGFVNYDDVVSIIHESDLVVHAEYDEPFNLLDLKAAFSTKIPDSISSGTPLFVYANPELACTDFVIKNKCAFVAKNKAELKDILEEALYNSEKREEVIVQAQSIKNKYFTAETSLTEYFS